VPKYSNIDTLSIWIGVISVSMGTNKRMALEWTQAVAAEIRAERAALHMTQIDVYTKAKMSRSTYLRIEAETRVPDVEDLAKIASAYELHLSTLIERVEARIEQMNESAKQKKKKS
jgi:transcriptional regulator with XRE-family HTH domain